MSEYRCSKCGATGCKLWRLYQSMGIHLLCVDCAGAYGDKDVSKVDAEGKRPSDIYPAHMNRFTFEIGWYVPAIPVEGAYWGYTSVPEDAIAKWKAIPTRSPKP